jgi:hypothetical protein
MNPTVHPTTYAHEFGILVPRETGIEYTHQAGGMSISQQTMEGAFLPLKQPTLYRGEPEWIQAVYEDDDRGVEAIDLSSLPDRDFESLPEWVADRGHFHGFDEYQFWLSQDDVWWYGWCDLIDELRAWNYDPQGDLLDRDMREAWDGLDDLWAAIDDNLPFTYEEYDWWGATTAAMQNGEDATHPLSEAYPRPGEAIKWITVEGSKRASDGAAYAPWADDLAGETVLLLYENAD